MTELKSEYTASEFLNMLKSGMIDTSKKGRLIFNEDNVPGIEKMVKEKSKASIPKRKKKKSSNPNGVYKVFKSGEVVEIELFNLKKISLNEWYAGKHWNNRTKIKNAYKRVIAKQTDLLIGQKCEVEYYFEFASHPLDASNTVAMGKMIEDIIFPNDGYKIVKKVSYSSDKGEKNKVLLKIYIL